jgi:phospho-N-acetylmuramoyl-pentapeptide-transferase
MLLNLVKIFIPLAFAFFIGLLITPIATHFFYKYKMWKKKVRTENTSSTEFSQIHKEKANSEISTPCVGGIIIFVSLITTTFVFSILPYFFPNSYIINELNFLSREQTIVPLFIFIFGALLGAIDDILEITNNTKITRDSNWYTKLKLMMVSFCALVVGFWFYQKLGMDSIHIPFGGELYLGIFFLIALLIVMLGTFSGGVIDGIDGLAGGVLASIFASYTTVAFINTQYDLAAFTAVITGSLIAFLWFNIPPARFYMGEVGMMPLTITLASVAFLTDSVLILPIIAFPLVATSLSSSIQLFSKKFFNKKVFKIAPLHHHFEAIGWPSHKVTMRYWVLSIIFGVVGIILFVFSK